MSRVVINTINDAKLALNDIYDQLDMLRTKGVDFKLRTVTGVRDPTNDLDCVNYETLKTYVADALAASTASNGSTLPANAPALVFNKSLIPKTDNAYSVGSSPLAWLKGWFYNLVIKALVGPSPLKINNVGLVTIGKIDLAAPSTDVSGVLARSNGGLGNAVATLYGGSCSGVFSGTISGTADLVTGAVTGTCTGTFSGTTSTSV